MKNLAHSLLPRHLARLLENTSEADLPDQTSRAIAPAPFVVRGSVGAPIVLASPHSGQFYPEAFVQNSRQPLSVLRSGEDSHIHLLAEQAHALGPALLYATFPRVFCDVNRSAWDLDTRMFHGPIPAFVHPTERGLAGLGSIPRIVGNRKPIYRHRLPFMEAALRIRHYWMPYHATLADMLDKTRAEHGTCLLLDLHSMPDVPEAASPDFVLGDAHGTTCHSDIISTAEQTLQSLGFRTTRNQPYAGGYITRHYGRPLQNLHALQIEMCRSLYMDEETHICHAGFAPLSNALATLTEKLLKLFPASHGL
ncbi:N-formylglutamate amidohydrolase [Acetobacter pasteurianus]|uniref:N-formylglutamate amidohydrolase n=1 Tax=Acetobacter pasteurianus TaxID=438 RepID=UPI000F560D48|nr:N-formylglutamate amidohydrolase [Acetobacter pasteurianus]GCD55025.1 N-formylglutamate amidohydrolase [Acetobacter pasteurianus NBRC 3222]